MRAREWTLASCYGDPTDYDIPELPTWRVCRPERGGIAFAARGRQPFIAAEQPVTVRR
ncbi:hypothetical protein [Halopenitus persicus]|uniref:Uncharacterized protein n=1 Tax=Halopenitus persicus TaxID=1048396 RepID=A0A1H3J4I6_9EURY|nr:hypothetical protein [Halopenitus persicus]SDY34846.1 hypothetical protein SAMN05216564_104388 [Halopenitus persicus]